MQTIASMRVLLLNSSYEPMQILTWQRALILFFQGKVEILEYYPIFARSVRSNFQLPSILRLKRYIRLSPKHRVRFCRENVYIRDEYTCQYCGDEFSPRMLTLDHVVPASHNGKKSWTNVVTACRECNQKKADRTPKQANMPLLKDPLTPNWLPTLEHQIKWDNVPRSWLDFLQIGLPFP